MNIKVFLGIIGSGKDYESSKCILENDNAQRLAFADPLRDMAWELLDWQPRDEKEYELFKINKLGHNGTGRHFLQKLGEICRRSDSEFWVNNYERRIEDLLESNKDVTVCCSDCRYPNEVDMFLRLGCKSDVTVEFIWCCYESDKFNKSKNDKHSSEKFNQFLLTKGLEHKQIIDWHKMIDYLLEYIENLKN